MTVLMRRTRIKICGITRPEDALAAAAAGVDAIGLIFAPRSQRRLTLEQAQHIRSSLPPLVSCVALVMDQPASEIKALLQQLHIDLLQFHGSETPAFCASFGHPYIKAMAMGGAAAVADPAVWGSASGLLYDAHAPGGSGGSGEVFDWGRLPRDRSRPLLLAGGLKPANVAAAVREVQPYAVDVSSGVEISPGIKDHALINQFVEEVRRGDTG
ncbi:MAG: phosphoribosylanthranilate isomerase [Wenzhouxiangellaceae bacterium]